VGTLLKLISSIHNIKEIQETTTGTRTVVVISRRQHQTIIDRVQATLEGHPRNLTLTTIPKHLSTKALSPNPLTPTVNRKEVTPIRTTVPKTKTMMVATANHNPSLPRLSMAKARTLLLARGRNKMLKKKSPWTPIRRRRNRKSSSRCMRMQAARTRMQRVMLGTALNALLAVASSSKKR
jgi:hypothetical protein